MYYKDNSKKRLLEVMNVVDRQYKPRLTEDINIIDPTKEEMEAFLKQEFMNQVDSPEVIDFDIAAAIYWFAHDYHGGQASNLYSALSTSEYKPGLMHRGIGDDQSQVAIDMYNALVNKYSGGAPEESLDEKKDDKWIQKAVDPEHEGYCTPMTKDTCTPRRKALAKRFKAGIEDESVQEAIQYPSPEEYRGKVEKRKQTIDNLFSEESYDVIDTLFRLLVARQKGAIAEQVGRDTENFGMLSGKRIWEYLLKNLSEDFKDKILGDINEYSAFVKGLLWGIENETSQFGADVFAKNAGAAPDEMVEAQDKGMNVVYTFKTKAQTEELNYHDRGEKIHEHNVHIIQGKPVGEDKFNGLILSIEDTPGYWYLSTLLEEPSALNYNEIAIDGGAKWYCTNWQEIAKELEQWLAQNQQ